MINLNNIQSSKIDVIKLGTNFQEIPENFPRDFSEITGIWNHLTLSTACDKWHWNYSNLQNAAEISRSGNFLYVDHKQRHDYTIWPRFENPVEPVTSGFFIEGHNQYQYFTGSLLDFWKHHRTFTQITRQYVVILHYFRYQTCKIDHNCTKSTSIVTI